MFLKNVKKATVVFSSARYPGTSSGSYKEIFPKDFTGRATTAPKKKVISEKLQEFNTKTLQQKLQFYSFKEKLSQGSDCVSGLGPVPEWLSSASSLTVFNTSQCPYDTDTAGAGSQVTEDPLEARARARPRSRPEDGAGGEAEEVSALGDTVADGSGDRDMFYLPELDLGDLPELDLPDDLELPNIASDLQVSRVMEHVVCTVFTYLCPS